MSRSRAGQRCSQRHRERGWIFLGAYAMLTVLVTLEVAYLNRTLTDSWATMRRKLSATAYHGTEGLLELAMAWLKEQALATPSSAPTATVELLDGAAPDVTLPAPLTAAVGFTPVRLTLTPCAQPPSPPCPLVRNGYQIQAEGRGLNGAVRTVTAIVQVESFADHAYFGNNQDDWRGDTPTADTRKAVWLQSGNEFFGPVFMNGWLYIVGQPIFHDTLSTATYDVLYYGPNWDPYQDAGDPLTGAGRNSNTNNDGITPTDPSFAQPLDDDGVPLYQTGQLRTGRPVIPFPDPASTMPTLLQAAANGGLVLSGWTNIQLDNGDLLITNPARGWSNERVPIPSSKVVCVEGDLDVSGTLDGLLTLCASPDANAVGGTIGITNHVRYAAPDIRDGNGKIIGVNPAGDDLLGLVAARDVYLRAAGAPPAPDNLEVHAIVMALGDSIRTGGLTGFSGGAPAMVLPDKGTVTFVGSVIENVTAPRGGLDANGATFHGYRGVYLFDPRVGQLALPLFPSTGRLRVLKHDPGGPI